MFSEWPTWKNGIKQGLQGTELITVTPTSKSPSVYEYELPSSSVLLFGPLSGFIVKGFFETKKKVDADNTWETIPSEKVSTVALQPNWFEHLIKDIRVFHGNNTINVHDVPRSADAFLNTFLYAHMYKDIKKYLFPEPENPGNCAGRLTADWSLTTETSIWRKYGARVFGDKPVTFRYVPAFLFPFYQQTNFCVDGRPPGALLMPLIQKMTISLQFKDNFGGIFMAPAADTHEYRFKLQSVELMLEEARLNPTFEKKLLSEKKTIVYPGLTRFAMSENITPGVPDHRVRFQGVPMPEGIFICALEKDAVGGTYKCSTVKTKVFMKHNIKAVDIKFGGNALNLKSPKIGEVGEHMIEIKQFLDHFENPPFGVLQEPDQVVFNQIKEGGKDTVYPHIYLNLTPSGKNTRIIPIGESGSIISKNDDLDLYLQFSHGGATADVSYLIYIFYTDANVIFDMKTKTFSPMYPKS